MATRQLNRTMQHLHRAALLGRPDTDGKLLERFVAARDEVAFEALVRRHGGMVMGVCRRVVGHHEDAEDAFQATFLILARKAAAVHPAERVGNWLYGVAYRTAMEARGKRARRQAREKQVLDMPHPSAEDPVDQQEALALLDRELSRLPDMYRVPVVLCDLEGRSRKESAACLHVPEGTLSSRLASARRMLSDGLKRRGVSLSAGALAFVAQQTAQAAVPFALVAGTVQAATQAAAATSPAVAALTETVLRSMFLKKVKILVSCLATCILLATSSIFLWQSIQAAAAAAVPPHADKVPVEDKPASVGTNNNALPPQDKKEKEDTSKQASFTKIHIKMGKAVIRQTGKESFAATGDPFFAKMAKAGVDKGTLFLDGPNPDAEFAVEVKELAGLTVEGVSSVEVRDLKVKRIEIAMVAVGQLIVSGSAEEQVILVKGGAAKFNGEACQGKRAAILVDGSSKAVVNVTDKLDVTIPASGQVEYLGSPEVEQKVSKAGQLRQRPATDPKSDSK